jgi:hypothetical protein
VNDDDWTGNEDFTPKNKCVEFDSELIEEKSWKDIF